MIFSEIFDSYCPSCNTHSIFEPFGNYKHYSHYESDTWLNADFFDITVRCTRNKSHKLAFKFHVEKQSIQKIGQIPCPSGKLSWISSPKVKSNDKCYSRFTGYLKDCKHCPLQEQCMRNRPVDRGQQLLFLRNVKS
jgi:hypothetical protein